MTCKSVASFALGVLLGLDMIAAGCGDSSNAKNDGATGDSQPDALPDGPQAAGGTTSSGGVGGAGGVAGIDGALGSGGAAAVDGALTGGASGFDGALGTGGGPGPDGGVDGAAGADGRAGDDSTVGADGGRGGSTGLDGGSIPGGVDAGGSDRNGSSDQTFEEVILPAAGGTVLCKNGISIAVPEGAVPQDTTIRIRRVPASEALAALEPVAAQASDLLFAFEALPSGLVFAKPITVSDSGIPGLAGVLPLVHEADLVAKTHALLATTITSRPDAGVLGFEVSHFTTNVATAGRQLANAECVATPCRCGEISVKQSDIEHTCDTCEMTESSVSVQFLDCSGSPTESSKLKEMSADCKVTLDLKPQLSTVAPNASTAVTAAVKLGCVPLANQTVDINSSPLGAINPTGLTTAADGTASTTFTAGSDEGTAVITARATASFYAYEITAGTETYKGPVQTQAVSKQASVQIRKGDERYRVDLAVRGENFYVVDPSQGDIGGYTVLISSYQAECSLEIPIKADDTSELLPLDVVTGVCTQQMGAVTATPQANDPSVPIQCIAASVQNVNCPASIPVKMMSCGPSPSYIERATRTGKIALVASSFDCSQSSYITGDFDCAPATPHPGTAGYLNSFQVAVTYADRQGNRFPEDTWNEVSVCFEATVEDGGELTNAPLSIELADGYSDSGDAYISGDLNVGLTYTLHVTRIQ